jgi:nitrite reductase/ring-hydroxylating ferredoxin subunit
VGLRSFIKGAAKDAARKAGIMPAPPTPRSADELLRSGTDELPQKPDADGYRAVVRSELLRDGEGNTFKLDGHNIAAFRVAGKVHVIDDECLHENGPLGEGKLEGNVVICPYHDWRYDVTTGTCLTEPDRHIACYAAREKDGFLWIGRRTRESSKERGGDHDDGLNTKKVDV